MLELTHCELAGLNDAPRIDVLNVTGNCTVYVGDCVESLRMMPDKSVHCCVTSPPYWGLRDYGTARWEGGSAACDHVDVSIGMSDKNTLGPSGYLPPTNAANVGRVRQYRDTCGKCGAIRIDSQLGLEKTPEEYVAKMVEVFREVRRVLKDDGTLWLNLGDSYANPPSGQAQRAFNGQGGDYGRGGFPKSEAHVGKLRHSIPSGLKPKDLVGIPWRVAFALQQSFYTGKISNENDRVWLAAMVDAEGSICGTEYETGDRTKTNIYICVTNTSTRIIDKCERLFPQEVKHVYEKTNSASGRRCFRWDVERIETKSMFLREIYPHLVAKRKQAILAYTFIEMQRGLSSKKKGYVPEQHDQRSWIMSALSRLNAGEDIDIPEWCVEPPSLNEPGFYLRQDIIWAKPNPMPESVTDRCTKSHEYIFLMSKSAKYWYDADAVKEASVDPEASAKRYAAPFFVGDKHESGNYSPTGATHTGGMKHFDGTRNRRSVWHISTRPYKGAHFATFPPALIEPCIKAGCPEGGTVLDPFGGSGTTGRVASDLGRKAILCELNTSYVELIKQRLTEPAKPLKKRTRDRLARGVEGTNQK